MKNYRKLVPVAAVALMTISLYSMISGAISEKNEVNELVKKAQNCSEQGLYDRAVSYYNEAINIDNNVDYYIAISDMYYNAGKFDSSKKWCEEIISEFPNEVKPYEKMIQVCLKLEKYSDAYSTLDDFDGRKLSSAVIENYRKNMQFLSFNDSLPFEEITQYSSDYVGVCEKNIWGLATVEGMNKINPKFNKIGYFANGIVPICDTENTWYFMNDEGEYLYNISESIDGNITGVGLYNNDLFPVCINGVYSFFDINFKKRFGNYEYAGSFSGGVAAVKESSGWKIIDADGKSINDITYSNVILDDRGICCQKDRIFVKTDDEYIMIDSKGQRIGSETFENARLFLNGDYAAIMRGELWGFVDYSGKTVISPKYQNAKSFSMGLAAVCDDDKWGYIDVSENHIIDLQYSDCLNFSSAGTAFVKDENSWEIVKLYKYNH